MDKIELESVLKDVGEKVTSWASSTLNIISEKLGIESSSLSAKLLAIIFLLVGLYGVLKITNKGIKIALLILIPILIISIIYSMFQNG